MNNYYADLARKRERAMNGYYVPARISVYGEETTFTGRPRFSDETVLLETNGEQVALPACRWVSVAIVLASLDFDPGNRAVSVWPDGTVRTHNYGGTLDVFTVNKLDDDGDVEESVTLSTSLWRVPVAWINSWTLMEVRDDVV